MLRYVALAFLLSSASSRNFSSAAGNIGCLFSETLCNQEKEWCIDDFAFGRCLPLYGSVREEDMFRYDLGTDELHVLELEMQRLFLLGYRWSHTYTQCVLQSLLKAIRDKSEFDVGACNAELDQDLEGALKAIEGEEMEHVDPRNLAIVRFHPSVVNPHSDYADEFYYPPVEEMLPPLPRNRDEQNETGESNQPQNHKSEPKQLPTPSKSPNIKEALEKQLESDINRQKEMKDSNLRLPMSPAAMAIQMYQDQQPQLPIDAGDYDYDLEYEDFRPYVLPLKSNYKRNGGGYNQPPIPSTFSDPPNYFRTGPPVNNDFKQLAHMLKHLRPVDRNSPDVYFPGRFNNIDQDFNEVNNNNNFGGGDVNPQGYFGEGPVRVPNFREAAFPPHLMEEKYPVFSSRYNLRGGVGSLANIRELEVPPEEKPEDDIVPNTIHNGYVKEFEDRSYQNDQPRQDPVSALFQTTNQNSGNIQNKYPYDLPGSDPFKNSVARFQKESESKFNYDKYQKPIDDFTKYDWKNDVTNNAKGYGENQPKYEAPPFGATIGNNMGVGAVGGQPPQMPNSNYYGRPMYSNYYYYDYPVANYDYNYDESYNAEQAPTTHWNLQRDERLDVKKPGPLFKSHNNFAFDYWDQNYGENDWLAKMDPLSEDQSLLMSKLQQGSQGGFNPKNPQGQPNQQQHQFPDLIMNEERYVEAVSKDARHRQQQGTGFPHAAPQFLQVATQQGKNKNVKSEQDSYVYISISGRFHSQIEAEQLINLIMHQVGLDMMYIKNLRVENNQVMFKVMHNNLNLSAAHLAEKTEELRGKIKEKTGMEIIQAGVGTKSSISAVVYSSGERQMLAVAAIICAVCAALLVGASVLFFLRHNARSKAKLQGLTSKDTEASKDYQDLCRARMSGKDTKESNGHHGHSVGGNTPGTHAPGQRISSLSKESDNGNNSPSSRSSTSSWSEEPVMSNMDISTGHMVLTYMEDHLKNKDRLDQEWVALCAYEAEPCACNIALRPENAQKNRYPDVVPYDHNRVILNSHTNLTGSNYVNGSTITDHDPRNPAYIATQGPLASTAADFWQLVWEQGSVVIVMLTRLTENGSALCHRYWPEEGSELYHIYEVHLVSEHIWCDDYLVRSFYLKNVRTGETRTVTQFHFLSWPESGIPASTKALLEFRRKVNKSYRGRSCPIIVHCSDGVGRTGTYTLIDMVLNRMAKGAKEIDIAATLEHIRDQRPSMVKTKTQFEFVLMAVAEEVHAILKALPQ